MARVHGPSEKKMRSKTEDPDGRCRCLRVAMRVLGGCAALLASGAMTLPVAAADKDKPRPAKLEVDGAGWWRDIELRRTLEQLLGEQRGPVLSTNAIEDAVFLLSSSLLDDGFSRPRIETVVTDEADAEHRFVFDATLATELPRTLRAQALRFEVQPGLQSRLVNVTFRGLHAISEETALRFFQPATAWLGRRAAPPFSPDALKRSLANLQGDLEELGYVEAKVRASAERHDEQTGAVSIEVEVQEGPRWEVASIVIAATTDTGTDTSEIARRSGQAWSPGWQRDTAEKIRQIYFREGYPDVRVRVVPEPAAPEGGRRHVKVSVAIDPGEKVRIGSVQFAGRERTRLSVLQRRVRAQPGDLYNPLALETARYRLARLGIFDSVDFTTAPAQGPVRDAIFTLRETPPLEASLLFGYGSYEQLRIGAEARQTNLLGRAHQSRLQLVQSTKSSRGDYTYTVPELLGERINGTARLFGLQREEIAFTRQEYGGNLSLRRLYRQSGYEATAGYTYETLRNKDNTLSLEGSALAQEETTAASVELGLSRDRRDNPLVPHSGHRWFAQVELASEMFGGESTYQRVRAGGTYHRPLGSSRWLHVGFSHSLIFTEGADGKLPPVNKLFYPGGENSIRGYQDGEATPRAADGSFVGAKTYTLLNVEFEQALTGQWSAVVFCDTLGVSARLREYPAADWLCSVGLGVRYRTLLGPLRLEYGRNLNPRVDDPSGTLHFSVGFPF
jgi:outer membrane protein insertion porin family